MATTTYDGNYVNCIYVEFNYDDAGIDSGLLAGTIPGTARIVACHIIIQTIFNAVTTNTITVGTTPTGTDIAVSTDIVPGTTGYKHLHRAFNLNPLTGATKSVYYRYTQTGTAATTGIAHLVVQWIF